jgi:sec-independent protein translocase protein TatB
MFGLGWGEMVVIGIVALIAIGPKELPTVLRTIGQWMGKVRRMANEFQGQFNEAIREAELTDLKKQAEDFTADIAKYDPIGDAQKDIEKSFEFDDPLKEKPADTVASTDTPAITDGEKLPAGAIPTSDLPPLDVPLPELPAPLTEKDFAPAPTTPAVAEAPSPANAPDAKPAGGNA